MRTIDANDNTVTVELARDELMIAANALNEVLDGPDAIENWEFQTRIGFDRDEAKRLHEAFLSV